MPTIALEVRNSSGLHARPAALFVETARRFSSDVKVANATRDPDKVASARSLLAVLALGITRGHTITISAEGADAIDALKVLGELIKSGVGEAIAPADPS